MEDLTRVTEASFDEEVCRSSTPVLVDFHTPACPPCRALAPVLQEIAADQAGRLKIVNVDASEEIDLAARFGVTAVPTLVLLKGCREVARTQGNYPKGRLLQALGLTS